MNYKAHLTMVSENQKTGPIPVSTTAAATCPTSCPWKGAGCFAENFHLKMHWDKVSNGERGTDWDSFCKQVATIPRKSLWRYAQAGDLPGDGVRIDAEALKMLVDAQRGRRGFTYTHYDVEDPHNLQAAEEATARGFTVNLSCDTLIQSDRLRKITDLPQSIVVPSTETRKSFFTEGGQKVIVCPTYYQEGRNCANCGICYEASPDRAVVAFPAHGSRKKVIDIRIAK